MKSSPGFRSFIVAAALVGIAPADLRAADLGGECCADLEERIAELEVTTARKGNRKVSLTISGWVGQQIMFWDDGKETNAYVHDLGSTLASHVKFSGQAEFAPGWAAGYVLQVEAISSDSLTISQNRPRGPAGLVGEMGGVQVLHSYWFVKSEQLGKFSLGKQSQASDNTAILVDGSGSLVPANWVAFDVASFRATENILNGLGWGAAGGCRGMGGLWGDCNGVPRNVMRYDTPTFAGFSASASWGEDDMWDVAVRFSGATDAFKISVAAAYSETTDESMGAPVIRGFDGQVFSANSGSKLTYLQIGAYLENIPTGLFLYGAYGILGAKYPPLPFVSFDYSYTPLDAITSYLKGGVRRRLNSLGHTVLYAEYLRNSDGLGVGTNISRFADGNSLIVTSSSEVDVWGLGVVQEIDTAAMSIWIKYRRMDFDFTLSDSYFQPRFGQFSSRSFHDSSEFQYIGAGAMISF